MTREVRVAGSTIGDRIKQARQQAGMTQPELAKACKWASQGRVSNYERGLREPKSGDVALLAKALDVSESWLWTGEDGGGNVTQLKQRRTIDGNAELVDHEFIEGDEPLRPDEVMLPMFREVEFAAGDGCTQVIENHGAQERFSLPRLSRAGVQPENAALAVAKGDSMVPAITDGATIGIDKGCRGVIDGKIYALDHDGMLRVKRLYRLPLNRVRVVSENDEEYPEEVYSLAAPDAPKILGRVFWWENFD
ncbi:XRE family transcriptional regulator [Halomonas eurihalina]|nr:S24 family peptidase [Halomonas eurihalina]MDR5859431.1 S24 family peptidase [Halomonas eurihalina]